MSAAESNILNLAQRCREILDWHKRGVLADDGELRRFADGISADFTDDQRLQMAEDKTKKAALRTIVAFAPLLEAAQDPVFGQLIEQAIKALRDQSERTFGSPEGAETWITTQSLRKTKELLEGVQQALDNLEPQPQQSASSPAP